MNIRIKIGNIVSKYNPFAILRRTRMRKSNKNNNITFLTPNCCGGILFHDLGLKFLSPTVNTMILQKDFLRLVFNLDEYLSAELNFVKNNKYNFPCATIHPDNLDEITIYFSHYETEEDALQKWKSRSSRINKENIFVLALENDGITKEEIESLAQLNVRGVVVFTYNEYPNLPYTVCIPKYKKSGCIGNINKRHYWNDSREYEDFFDFVSWFNEANGGDYNVEKYKRV